MPTSNDIRATFLGHFASHGHAVVPSSPLVPHDDPTLLFVNSGMVQFKNVFTGREPAPYPRAASAQKCVRAGGKHNDLDNVGYTARHHTFFEMMGNFSFGDYFKAEAIEHAWTLVTKGFGLPADRLLVTVFHEDEEAAGLWRRIAGLADERIIRIASSDNFWRMGETGPCGPCSEIFYDHGPAIAGGPPGSPDEDGDRFIEIWNLVFMQYVEDPPGARAPLPRPSIDTGLGLERFAAILQGVHDNYDTDIFRALVAASAELTGQAAGGAFCASHRVVADHLRSASFLIADGVLPSNEGRGYVLRRIMRRAMRHLHMMHPAGTLYHRLLPALLTEMGGAYPELARSEALIDATLRAEEERFKTMLDRGLGLLAEETARLGAGEALSGDVAFRLHDTYGFPLDLTQDALREQGRGVDVAGFEVAMQEQRRRARAAWQGGGEGGDRVWFDLAERGRTEFLGYETETADAGIVALVVDGEACQGAGAGVEVAVVLDRTPFYAESGGQMGDAGFLTGEGTRVAVRDTQRKPGGLVAHLGIVEAGTLRVGQTLRAEVDHARRGAIRAHHSATHLLHEALRRRLGDHVAQKGSLNAPDRLRFDISHPAPVTPEELRAVEAEVNARIRENAPVETRIMSPEQAAAEGAMALFGEKYGDEVRVVSMGVGGDGRRAYSIELCGGTHVARTGDIGLFRIVGEGGTSAGVRRLEAVTGAMALSLVDAREALLAEVATVLRTPAGEAPARAAALQEENRRLSKQLAEARGKLAAAETAAAESVGGIAWIGRVVGELPPRELKGLAETTGRAAGEPAVVSLLSTAEGKASLVVWVSPDLKGRFDAVSLVRTGAEAMGGKGGGGRPELAQAGGPDAGRAAEALAAIRGALEAA